MNDKPFQNQVLVCNRPSSILYKIYLNATLGCYRSAMNKIYIIGTINNTNEKNILYLLLINLKKIFQYYFIFIKIEFKKYNIRNNYKFIKKKIT